ncbi:MAG: DUF1792 domain-containing protein [Lachnospiraceae bacterium]|nr:DUF1792 domain-containing protein [Lachnospiraceae bacterium]
MLLQKIKALLKTLYYWVLSIRCVKRSVILNPKDTVDYIVKNKKSIIRFGDGEFFLMDGNDIHYQKCSKELQEELSFILDFYLNNSEKCGYLLCMPRKYFKCSGFYLLKKKVYIRSWVRPRYVFSRKFDLPVVFGDAFLFTEENIAMYKKIWDNQMLQKILFIHNNEKYAKKFGEDYKKKVFFIKIPTSNAFDQREIILEDINRSVKENSIDMVLVSAGPCAKYLVKELSLLGIWAIDTGHCWDEPLI